MYWLLSVCSILHLFQTLGVDPWHHHRPPLSRPLNRFSQWETPTKDQSREERGAGECSPRKPHCCALAPRLRQWPRSPHDHSRRSPLAPSSQPWAGCGRGRLPAVTHPPRRPAGAPFAAHTPKSGPLLKHLHFSDMS